MFIRSLRGGKMLVIGLSFLAASVALFVLVKPRNGIPRLSDHPMAENLSRFLQSAQPLWV
jgi:hypothetical protein